MAVTEPGGAARRCVVAIVAPGDLTARHVRGLRNQSSGARPPAGQLHRGGRPRRHDSSMRAPSSRSALLVVAALVPAVALAALGVVRITSGGETGTERAASRSILNPHPAAGPFAVDDTTLADCGDASDRRRCLEQAFGNLAYRTTGKRALAVMATRGAEQPDVSAGCHRIAHTIGAAVLAQRRATPRRRWRKATRPAGAASTTACSSGRSRRRDLRKSSVGSLRRFASRGARGGRSSRSTSACTASATA